MTSVEQNKEIVRRWNEEVLGQGKLELIDEVIHPDYINYDADMRGLAAAREGFAQMAASADARVTVDELIAEGDLVALRWQMSDGAKRYRGMTFNRIADGKIIEDWFCFQEIT